MKTFEDWFKELCSNYVWFQPASMHHKPETFRAVANKVYMQYVAAEVFPPIQEARKHVYNKLVKEYPGDKVKIDWVKAALEKGVIQKEDVKPPLTGEERMKKLKEWDAIVKGSTMLNSMPKPSYKELAEEGGVLPPKPAPYPCTSKEEAYIRDRHFEYIKANFEARTGNKLPSWISEEDWNIQYDNENL